MLVKVILPNGEPVEYEYDGNQRLISRKSSDGVDNFVQSGWDIVTKMDDVGKRTYYTGSSAMESEDSVKYFHYNHRGDTVLVTDSEGVNDRPNRSTHDRLNGSIFYIPFVHKKSVYSSPECTFFKFLFSSFPLPSLQGFVSG